MRLTCTKARCSSDAGLMLSNRQRSDTVGVPVRRKRQSADTTDRQGGGGEKDGGIASGRTRRVRSGRVGGRRAAPLVRRASPLTTTMVGLWWGERSACALSTAATRFRLRLHRRHCCRRRHRHVKCYHHSARRPEPRRPTPPDTRYLRSYATTVQQTMYG